MIPLSVFWQWEVSWQALTILTCRNTMVMLMVLPRLASFFYVCYHAFTPHSFFSGLLLHIMSKLTAYSIFVPCWISFLCSPVNTWVCISLTDHGWAVYGLATSSASLFPFSPLSCVWCVHFCSCCLTNLWFYMWHHRVRVIRTKENKLAVDNLQLGNMLLQLNHIKVKLLAGQ